MTSFFRKRLLQLYLIPTVAFVAASVIAAKQPPFTEGYVFPTSFFLTVAAVIFGTWETHFLIYDALDRRLPFADEPTRRIIWQVALGWLATLAVYAVVTLAANALKGEPFRWLMFVRFSFLAIGISTILNGIYLVWQLQQTIFARDDIKTRQLQAAIEEFKTVGTAQKINAPPQYSADFLESPTENAAKKTVENVAIESGSRILNFHFSEIDYLFSSDGLVFLMKTDGQKLMTNYNALSKIENRLPIDRFFQLNRQLIVQPTAVRAVEDDINRKLVVTLVRPLSIGAEKIEKVVVSRYRSAAFKLWFSAQLGG